MKSQPATTKMTPKDQANTVQSLANEA